MNVLTVYYSLYGHVSALAQAAAEGVAEIPGAVATLRRVPETLPPDVIEKMGAADAQKSLSVVPVCTLDELEAADAILFGTPTRFGNMCGQMRQFLDATGGLWVKNALVGKPAGVFASSNTQHGGQESTILTFLPFLLHQGMVVAGLPYTFLGQRTMDEITGCSPYGASTIAGMDGSRMPSANELDGVKFQARHLARIGHKLMA